MEKKKTKDQVLLEIVKRLSALPAAQLLCMLQVIQAAGDMALKFSEACEKAGGPVGVNLNLVRSELPEVGINELKS